MGRTRAQAEECRRSGRLEGLSVAGPGLCNSCLWRNRKSADGSYVLDSRVTLFEAADEPAPVRRATEDLADDFYSVFGTRPRIVNRQADAGLMTILIGEPSAS